jgi:hypothetical protein
MSPSWKLANINCLVEGDATAYLQAAWPQKPPACSPNFGLAKFAQLVKYRYEEQRKHKLFGTRLRILKYIKYVRLEIQDCIVPVQAGRRQY